MTALDDVNTTAETARNAVSAAQRQTEAAMGEAYEKTHQAAAFGLQGVAARVQAAHGLLEAVASSLDAAHATIEATVATLAEITDDMAAHEAIAHLDTALGSLCQTTDATDTGVGAAGEAHTYAQQADLDNLTAMTDSVLEGLHGARLTIDNARAGVQVYRQQVDTWAST